MVNLPLQVPKSFARWSASHSDSRSEGVSLGVSKLLRHVTGKRPSSAAEDEDDQDGARGHFSQLFCAYLVAGRGPSFPDRYLSEHISCR